MFMSIPSQRIVRINELKDYAHDEMQIITDMKDYAQYETQLRSVDFAVRTVK